jgi:hypothetical protein
MAFKTNVLVLANRTAGSEGLAEALRRRAERDDVSFRILVPTGRGGREGARSELDAALEQLRGAGLDVDGQICDADPLVAVADVWDPRAFDEVIVSTLERDSSRWLAADLPHRIARLTDAPVSHVVPAEIELSLARERRNVPRHREPQRALGPFAGPAVR